MDVVMKCSGKDIKKTSRLGSDDFFYQNHLTKNAAVLFEAEKKEDHLYGFTENYIKVKTRFDNKLVNQIKRLRSAKYQPSEGILVGEPAAG